MSEAPNVHSPTLRERVVELGALRIALLTGVAVLGASALFTSPFPFAGSGLDGAEAMPAGASTPSGEREIDLSIGLLWPTLIAPPLAVMMFFVVPLDMLMSRIYMADKRGAERARYRRILTAEGTALALLVAAWTPFFASLLSF